MPQIATTPPPSKPRGNGLLVILLVPVGFVLLIFGTIFGLDVYNYLYGQIEMSQIKLPAGVTLQSKSWTFGDHIDNPPAWTYTYDTGQDRSVVFQGLISSLQSAGYTVDTPDPSGVYGLEAYNDTTHLDIGLKPTTGTRVATVTIFQTFAGKQNIGNSCQGLCIEH